MKKSSTLTIRLAPELRDRLLSEMEASGRTADAVVSDALNEDLRFREATRAFLRGLETDQRQRRSLGAGPKKDRRLG